MQDINFRRHYVRHLPKEVSQQDIIRTLASPLINDGMVVSDFADHVIEREKSFPTGLAVEPVGVAIPHTDHQHVRQNAISIRMRQFRRYGRRARTCSSQGNIHACIR